MFFLSKLGWQRIFSASSASPISRGSRINLMKNGWLEFRLRCSPTLSVRQKQHFFDYFTSKKQFFDADLNVSKNV